jgi:hypothetical protein
MTFMPGMLRHLDFDGRPLCGAPALGAFVVERVRKTTCPCCLQVVEALAAHGGSLCPIPDADAEWLFARFVAAKQERDAARNAQP